nr:hypothetical protein [Paracidovorax avenae]
MRTNALSIYLLPLCGLATTSPPSKESGLGSKVVPDIRCELRSWLLGSTRPHQGFLADLSDSWESRLKTRKPARTFSSQSMGEQVFCSSKIIGARAGRETTLTYGTDQG